MKRDEGVRLSWQGKTCVFDPATAESSRRVLVAEGGKGSLHLGDNRASLAAMASELGGRVTLAYLDPPFLTNRAFEAIERLPPPESGKRIVRAGPLKTRPKKFAFDDRWSSRGEYLEALGQRLVLVRELLAPHGSVVVHVDPKTSHYVKVLCDEIFGDDAFASEIVWRYRRWPSKTPNFQRVHDVLLRYRKDPKAAPRWNQPYEPLAASTIATWGTNKQRAVFEEDGRRARSSTTAEATKGVPMGDVWEIGVLAPVSKERTGYPSQKPEALLERIVSALSDPGDVVLDPYAGSGTTLAVAARLGRTFVGCDASEVAFGIATARLERAGIRFDERPLGQAPSGTARSAPRRDADLAPRPVKRSA
ncbi:MAG: site-specific DNA-methyltransferase [Labilithrix sp.]|nr:site-specific DNA-methyltransferase [Labilithrix sp.]